MGHHPRPDGNLWYTSHGTARAGRLPPTRRCHLRRHSPLVLVAAGTPTGGPDDVGTGAASDIDGLRRRRRHPGPGGDDTLTGTRRLATIEGDGADTVNAGDGSDTVRGGAATTPSPARPRSLVPPGGGGDIVDTGKARDAALGGNGARRARAGATTTSLQGGSGQRPPQSGAPNRDTCTGQTGVDITQSSEVVTRGPLTFRSVTRVPQNTRPQVTRVLGMPRNAPSDVALRVPDDSARTADGGLYA